MRTVKKIGAVFSIYQYSVNFVRQLDITANVIQSSAPQNSMHFNLAKYQHYNSSDF